MSRARWIRVLALAASLWSLRASATTVAIVRPIPRPPLMTETLGRIRGELTSLGFATVFVDEPERNGADERRASRAWLEELATRRDFDAVVAIVGDGSPDSVEVWVVDKVTKKSVVRTVRLDSPPRRVPEILAVRAIELLRSSFLEIDLAGSDPSGEGSRPPPPAVARFLNHERQRLRPERFALELGGLAVMSLDGIGPALLPMARFDWALPASLGTQVTVAGLGTRPTVENREGRAQISEAHGTLGVYYAFDAGHMFRPFAVLSAGVLRTAVEGRTDLPQNEGRRAHTWSFLLDGGVGSRIQLRDRLFLSFGFGAQLAQPRPAIRIVDEVVARSAGPNLLLDLGVGTWL